MTLRTRLALAAALVVAVFAVVGVVVPNTVRAAQLRQVDSQLTAALPAVAANSGAIPNPGVPSFRPAPNPLAELYVARIDSAETRDVVVTPASAGDRAPVASSASDPVMVPGGPAPLRTVASVNGGSRWRTLVIATPRDGERIQLGVSLDRIDSTTRRLGWSLLGAGLAVALTMGLGGWWIARLGLRPIGEVTAVADAIAAGERDRRASEAHPGTEAARLARAVNMMLDERNAAESQLRQFVADASHELRTPVAAIRGFSDLHRQGGLDDDATLADAMRRIGQEAHRMGGLVDDLLLLARLDQGRPLERAPVDLSNLIADAVLDASATHPSRPVMMSVQPGLCVIGDEARLRQVLANLVTNALVHGGGEASVTITARATGGTCAIDVIDDGPGMDTDAADHAFDRFWRGEVARTRRRAGSGLGLSIVRAIVEAHDGRITLETSPARGTLVRVVLPDE
jgi:two-component system, OmpR family, sensor kinase